MSTFALGGNEFPVRVRQKNLKIMSEAKIALPRFDPRYANESARKETTTVWVRCEEWANMLLSLHDFDLKIIDFSSLDPPTKLISLGVKC